MILVQTITKRLALIAAAIILVQSCKKDSTPPATNGGGNGGGGQNGSAHVSSWSPAVPYTDDTVTFHGSGFDPIASQNIVRTCNQQLEVVSATSTQLRVRVPSDITSCIFYTDQSTITFQASGWSDTLAAFHWKKIPRIIGVNGLGAFYCNALVRAGDSLEIEGIGFGPSTLASWDIGGYSVPGAVLDSTGIGYLTMRVRIPPGAFGGPDSECDTATVMVHMIKNDGRAFSSQTRIGRSPHMLIQGVETGFVSQSRSDMIANNLVINPIVHGKYLKQCMTVRLLDQTSLVTTIGGPPPGFPDSYSIGPIDPASLSVGIYRFVTVDCEGVASFPTGEFTLTP